MNAAPITIPATVPTREYVRVSDTGVRDVLAAALWVALLDQSVKPE